MPSLIQFVLILAVLAGGEETMKRVRFATFNIKLLSTAKINQIDDEGAGDNPQLKKAAEIIQRNRPDILLINEIDFDADTRRNAELFRDRYLSVSQNGQRPVDFAHVFFEPVNTGLPTGKDLSNDGKADGPEDAFGYGNYPGQYGMALFSRFPIDHAKARTFQKFLWKDMPGYLMPDGQDGRPEWYSPDEVAILRLSSKSHWDVPVRIGPTVVHLLCAHPTPPVFDGPEDRNGRRTFDEIRLWADYLTGGDKASYIVDDKGRRGGLAPDAPFIIMGDLNADPIKDPQPYGTAAADQLLKHPRVQDPTPISFGGLNSDPPGPPGHRERRTAHFGRVDYVLPSKKLKVLESAIFWPPKGNPRRALIDRPDPSSDHRLVWVDVQIPTR
jgi:endonuclease/exonuclease/phosphatase family metal-dependent hydrolase